jgi:hypothetical protein
LTVTAAEADIRERLARVEANQVSHASREDEIHEMHRQERRESEARVMLRIDRTDAKIDHLADIVTAVVRPPASAVIPEAPAFTMSVGSIPPKAWGVIFAIIAGSGILGSTLTKALNDEPPVIITTSGTP